MLEPLIVDMLMTSTMVLLAGWASDTLGRLSEAGRSSVGQAPDRLAVPRPVVDRE